MCPIFRKCNPGRLAALVLLPLSIVALPARAVLVNAGEPVQLYRYVEKATCYTIITNIPPDPSEVATRLAKDQRKTKAFCSPAGKVPKMDLASIRVARPARLPPPAPHGARLASLNLPLPALRGMQAPRSHRSRRY